ncbi:MAG: tRNA uridine-5-carboxymethylaminomethyl(34) synthesis GTPase MnmE [Wolinella sp.]
MSARTIVALGTPAGSGALSVVKISGDNALRIALSLSRRTALLPRHATLATVFSRDGEMLDEAILLYFKAPHSYTAEDVVEIQCHGGVYIARQIVNEVIALGAEIARSGEFTYRAFLNGRIDLSQAEAIGKLIELKSASAHKILMRQLKGSLGQYVSQAREKLIEILAFTEVSIDYAEEDLPEDLENQIMENLTSLSMRFEHILDASLRRSSEIEGYKMAIIGRPNVGKSSLLNALLMSERAIVSDVAGTTRDTIEESLSIGNNLVKIIDTAGIRDSSDAIEMIGVERALGAVKDSDVVLAIFDSSRELGSDDLRIKELLLKEAKHKRIVVIFNKSDLGRKLHDIELESYPHHFVSAKLGELGELFRTLEGLLEGDEGGEEVVLTSERQLDSIRGAICALKEARVRLKDGMLELFAYHIHEAIDSLVAITRPYESGELLDVMFGRFCLGK